MRRDVTITTDNVTGGINSLLFALEESDLPRLENAAAGLAAFTEMFRRLRCAAPAAPAGPQELSASGEAPPAPPSPAAEQELALRAARQVGRHGAALWKVSRAIQLGKEATRGLLAGRPQWFRLPPDERSAVTLTPSALEAIGIAAAAGAPTPPPTTTESTSPPTSPDESPAT